MSEEIAGVKTSERFEIDLGLIDLIDGHQHRLSRDEHQETARIASMEHEGQFVDILVRRSVNDKKRFELIDGEGRLSDAKKLGQKTIGARIIQANDGEAALISLQANYIRQGINPMEFAYGLKRAIDNGVPMEECLKRLGKVTPDGKPDMHFGKEMMKLLELEPEEQELVAKNLLSKNSALELSKLEKNIRSRVIKTAKEIEGEKAKTAKPAKKEEAAKPSALKLTPSTTTPKGPPAPPKPTKKAENKISDKTVREAKKKVGIKDGPRFIGMKAVKELEEKLEASSKVDDEQKKVVKQAIDYMLGRRKTIPF